MALHHFRNREEESAGPETEMSSEDESALEAAMDELKASEEVAF
jgi:hypothetical protein